MHYRYQILHGQKILQLNEDKTEILSGASKALRQQIHSLFTPLPVKPCEHARNLGVILDAYLTIQERIFNISMTAFHHLRNMSKVRHLLAQSLKCWLMHLFLADLITEMHFSAGLTKQV